jgi:hypothetical protein
MNIYYLWTPNCSICLFKKENKDGIWKEGEEI